MRFLSSNGLVILFSVVTMIDVVFGVAALKQKGFAKWLGILVAVLFVPLDVSVIYQTLQAPQPAPGYAAAAQLSS